MEISSDSETLTPAEHLIELLADPDEGCPLGHLLQFTGTRVGARRPEQDILLVHENKSWFFL